MAAGDMQLAMEAAMAGVTAAFTRGANALMSKVDEMVAHMMNTWDGFKVNLEDPSGSIALALGSKEPALINDPRRRALADRQAARIGQVGENDNKRAAAAAAQEAKLKALADEAAAKRGAADAANAAMDRLSNANNMLDVDLARQQIGPLLDSGNLPAGLEQRLVDSYQKKITAMAQGAGAVAGPGPAMLAGVAGLEGINRQGMDAQANDLLKSITNARSESSLDDAIGEFKALKQFGRINGEQESVLMGALENAVGRMQQQPSQAEVAGSFSSSALGGMGFGGSLASKQLDEQKETNRILKEKLGLGEVMA
jgi:hypothetical protein